MKEKVQSPVTRAQINEAARRYQVLLDHYKIEPDVQGVAQAVIWASLRSDAQGTIEEIKGYCEEAFGSDGSKGDGSAASGIDPKTGLPKIEAHLYGRRKKREQRRRHNAQGPGGNTKRGTRRRS